MGVFAVAGGMVKCTFGTAPATLNVTSQAVVMYGGKLAATIQDAGAFANIPPLGMCSSMANPQVAAATAAALGVLTPQPCIPSTGSWMPTQTVCLAGGKPCITNDAICLCAYGGSISFTNPGQNHVMI